MGEDGAGGRGPPRGPTPDFCLHPASRIRTPLYCLAASRLPRSVPAAEGIGMQTRFSVITGTREISTRASKSPSRDELVVIVYNLKRMMKVLGRPQLAAGLAPPRTAFGCSPFAPELFRTQKHKSDAPELGMSPLLRTPTRFVTVCLSVTKTGIVPGVRLVGQRAKPDVYTANGSRKSRWVT
jgi:hypothetical protein